MSEATLPAWQAEPVSDAGKEALFRQTVSFTALEQRMWHRWWAMGWIVGAFGLAAAVASGAATAIMVHKWQPETRFVQVDTSTGWVGDAVGAMDAPRLFNDRVAAQALRTYIENREGYLPVKDRTQYDAVHAMSAATEFERYEAWRKSDLSPLKQLGTTGRVEVRNFVPSPPAKGRDGTVSYVVRFSRREIKGSTVGPEKHWRAVVDFQWHPEMHQSTPDSQVNPAGMQVLAYKSEED